MVMNLYILVQMLPKHKVYFLFWVICWAMIDRCGFERLVDAVKHLFPKHFSNNKVQMFQVFEDGKFRGIIFNDIIV